jgi:hypothetical protein
MTEIAVNPPIPPPPDSTARRLLFVSWWAILAGFVVQLLVLGSKLIAAAALPAAQMISEVGSGITWSILVCGGVALGTAAASPSATVMGGLGFLFAPLGFAAAKGIQRGIQAILDVPPAEITSVTWTIGAIKAVEFAILGAMVAVLLRRAKTSALSFAALGLLLGVLFGGMIITVMATQGNEAAPALVGAGVNEVFFPMACALILYSASRAGKHVRAMAKNIDKANPAK